jgi:hypothetical protein
MNYYSMGEFAKLIGKIEQTLRNWGLIEDDASEKS